MLNNTSNQQVVFRIQISTPSLFVLKMSDGVLDPGQKIKIPVVLKAFPSDFAGSELFLAKFSVQVLECEDDYYIMGSASFWKLKAPSAICTPVQSKAIKSQEDFADNLNEAVNVTPECLYFKGKGYSVLFHQPCNIFKIIWLRR